MDEAELKKKLTDKEYSVLREGGTETPFSGKLLNNKEAGMYTCKVCGNELFSSDTKFESGTGWPSFYDLAHNDAVELVEDNSAGMKRTEVRCAKCKSHLGHLFEDGPQDKTGKRYCINSVCLDFKPEEK